MSRRRYLSTAVSVDKMVKRLAMESGDFAALLYTWMIPHADDNGVLTGDPEELLDTVMPGRRDKDPEDVEAALGAMERLSLIECAGGAVGFPPESFYKYQTMVPVEKRRTAPLADFLHASSQPAQTSEERRGPAKNAEDQQEPAEKGASPSPSPSPSPSLTPSGEETRAGAREEAPPLDGADGPGEPDEPEDEAPAKGRKPKDPPPQEAVFLASWLSHLITRNNPKAVIKDGQREKWAGQFDLQHRVDGASWEDMRAALDWAHTDNFWRGNVLSADALRRNWNQITQQMQRGNGGNGAANGAATHRRTGAFGAGTASAGGYGRNLAITDDADDEDVPEVRSGTSRAAP